MKQQLLLLALLFCLISRAQTTKLNFTYDNSGNQKTRILCINCLSKPNKEITEISSITQENLNKFSDDDVISYYPNPVKEELYLQWELQNENYITSIQIFSITGQLLKQYLTSNKIKNKNVPFQSYPSGMYIVLLKYNKGEEKTIKIIKQ